MCPLIWNSIFPLNIKTQYFSHHLRRRSPRTTVPWTNVSTPHQVISGNILPIFWTFSYVFFKVPKLSSSRPLQLQLNWVLWDPPNPTWPESFWGCQITLNMKTTWTIKIDWLIYYKDDLSFTLKLFYRSFVTLCIMISEEEGRRWCLTVRGCSLEHQFRLIIKKWDIFLYP